MVTPLLLNRQAQGKETYRAIIVTALDNGVCVCRLRLPSQVLEENLGSRVPGVLKIESTGSAAHTILGHGLLSVLLWHW